MNILINYTGPKGSGPVFSLELAKGLVSLGCSVYAVLSRDIPNADEWRGLLPRGSIRFVETHAGKKDFLRKTVRFLLKGRKELTGRFGKIDFDYSIRTFFTFWARFIDKALAPKKIVSFCHDPVLHHGEPFYLKLLHRRFIRESDEIVVLTKSFIPVVQREYRIPPRHIHYIPHGRMDMYKRKQTREITAGEKEKLGATTNFLFFGRIEKYKGLHILAEAYGLLRRHHDDVTLTIAGSGRFDEYRDRFNGLKNVEIINGYIPDEDVGYYFSRPNVVAVLPYTGATQSGVIPIAFEYETPVIASNTGGLAQQLDDGRIGLFFEAGNAGDLARTMALIMENPSIRTEQAVLMRRFRETLNWDRVAKRLLEHICVENPNIEVGNEREQAARHENAAL